MAWFPAVCAAHQCRSLLVLHTGAEHCCNVQRRQRVGDKGNPEHMQGAHGIRVAPMPLLVRQCHKTSLVRGYTSVALSHDTWAPLRVMQRHAASAPTHSSINFKFELLPTTVQSPMSLQTEHVTAPHVQHTF